MIIFRESIGFFCIWFLGCYVMWCDIIKNGCERLVSVVY